MSETLSPIKSAFQLRGSLFTLSVLQLHQVEVDKIDKELKPVLFQAPKFFDYAPIVIDCQQLQDPTATIDFPKLLQCLRAHKLIPVGIRGGSQTQHDEAKAAGLAILSIAKTEEPQLATRTKVSAKNRDDTPKAQTVCMSKPVRSGQQIYAKDGDLIVIGSVSQGAELLADGNIHVYGALRGRALAGVNGNTDARIFCHSMQAELVSIAGRYIVNETLINQDPNSPAQIYLEDGKLIIMPLYKS